jgi:hypothetical protein
MAAMMATKDRAMASDRLCERRDATICMTTGDDGVTFLNDIHDALCATPALLSLSRAPQTDLSDFLYILNSLV